MECIAFAILVVISSTQGISHNTDSDSKIRHEFKQFMLESKYWLDEEWVAVTTCERVCGGNFYRGSDCNDAVDHLETLKHLFGNAQENVNQFNTLLIDNTNPKILLEFINFVLEFKNWFEEYSVNVKHCDDNCQHSWDLNCQDSVKNLETLKDMIKKVEGNFNIAN